MPSRRRVLGFFLLAAWPGVARATEPELLDPQRLSFEQRRRLAAGEVLSLALPERGDRDVAAAVVAHAAAPLEPVAAYLGSGEILAAEPAITASGRLDTNPRSLAGFRYGPADVEEVDGLLAAAPGSRYNLAPAEIEAFRALRASVSGGDRAAAADAVSRLYASLLAERWQTYLRGGAGAIPPYARRGALVDPVADLRGAADDAVVLARALPGLRDTLLGFPAGIPSGVSSRFYWLKRTVQGRATPILVHHLVQARPPAVVQVERHIHVGHSYTGSQIITAGLTLEGGTLLAALARVWTEQVTGLGGELKRAVARRHVRTEQVARLQRMRAAVERSTALAGRGEAVQAP